MGNLRSRRRRPSSTSAPRRVSSDPAEIAAADGAGPARRRARFPRRCSEIAGPGWPRRSTSAPAAGVPRARHLPGDAAAVRVLDRARAAPPASACSTGAVEPLAAPGLKLPHIGWAPVMRERESALTAGIDRRRALLFRPLLRRQARPDELIASAAHGERFAAIVGRGNVLRNPVPPREVERGGAARCSRNFAAVAAGRGVTRATLYPAIDIRDGRAVRLLQGDYDRETAYDADPVDAARRWVDGGARVAPRRRPRRRPGGRAREPRSVVARIAAAVDVPVQLGGGLRDRAGVEAAFAAGAAARGPRHRAPSAPRLAASSPAAYGERIVASVDARAGRVAVEGWEEATDDRRRGRDRRPRPPRRPPLRLHPGRGRRDARRARRSTGSAPSSAAARRPGPS